MGPGLTERTLHRLISLLQLVLLTGLLVSAGYQSYFIFFKAQYFRIREVKVLGCQALPREEIVRLSGIQLRDLFFRYNYDRVRRRLLSNPRIERADIHIQSPNTVEIRLVERTPRFLMHEGRKTWEVDQTGIVLGTAEPRPQAGKGPAPAALPELKGGVLVPTASGPQLQPAQAELLAQWAGLLAKGPLKDFNRIDVTSPHRLEVRWKDHAVLVSDPAAFDRNVGLMDRALSEAQDRGKQVGAVDLRFSNLVLKIAEAEQKSPVQEKATTPPKKSPAAQERAAAVPDEKAAQDEKATARDDRPAPRDEKTAARDGRDAAASDEKPSTAPDEKASPAAGEEATP